MALWGEKPASIRIAYIIGFCAEELADPDTLPTVRYEQLSAERYPHLSSLTSVLARLDMETEFERGLELLLDGLEHHRAPLNP